MPELNRDELYVDSRLVDLATNSALRLARMLRVDDDVVDRKEIYRTIMQVAVDYTIIRDGKE